jgi:hypothetical protein
MSDTFRLSDDAIRDMLLARVTQPMPGDLADAVLRAVREAREDGSRAARRSRSRTPFLLLAAAILIGTSIAIAGLVGARPDTVPRPSAATAPAVEPAGPTSSPRLPSDSPSARTALPAPPSGLARDGQVAYVVNVPDPAIGHPLGGTLYLADPDGRNPRAVTGTQGIDIHPLFSPNGSTLVFSSRPPNGDWVLYAASAGGSGARQISERRRNGNPATASYFTPTLSPDGRRVAYDDLDATFAASLLFVVDADGGSKPVAITTDQADAYDPRWSPDGQWIAFRSYAPARCFLGSGPCDMSVDVVHPDGTGLRSLLKWSGTSPGLGVIDWNPDSAGLVIAWPAPDYRYHEAAPPDGHVDLREVRLDQTSSVLQSFEAASDIGRPSPDGRWLAYNTRDQILVRPRTGGGDPWPLLATAHGYGATPQGGLTLWEGCWFLDWSPQAEIVASCDDGISLIPDPTDPAADHSPRTVVPLEPGPMFGVGWQRIAP